MNTGGDREDEQRTTLELELEHLVKSDRTASMLRRRFARRRLTVINLIGSTGAGKTTLLAHAIPRLDRPVVVIEGDRATAHDVQRIAATGAPVVRINTGAGCHLDATMIEEAVEELAPEPGSLIAIENAGNLVYPTLFDLGEAVKVAVISIAEGVDKPLEHPDVFRAAAAMVVTKMDLAPGVDVDPTQLLAAARAIHPGIALFETDAISGVGLDAWCRWLDALAPRPAIDAARGRIHPRLALGVRL